MFEQEFTDVDGLMGPYLMHPDPLGGGRPLVRSRMPRCDRSRSRVPQLLLAGLADPALAFLREQTQNPLRCEVLGALRLLGGFTTGYMPAGRMFGLAVAGGSSGGSTEARRGCAPAAAATTDSAG